MNRRTWISSAVLSLVSLLMVGCGAGSVTKVNFDKVQNGMSRKDVEALLGKPVKIESISGPSDIKMVTWNRGAEPAVMITFLSDKAQGKVAFGAWQYGG